MLDKLKELFFDRQIYKHQIEVYDTLDSIVQASECFRTAESILINTGCFGEMYYQHPRFLQNLETALKNGASVEIVFGPAINIQGTEPLFRLFHQYLSPEVKSGYVTLNYRKEHDKEGWDQKHFFIIKEPSTIKNPKSTMIIEEKHDEYSRS